MKYIYKDDKLMGTLTDDNVRDIEFINCKLYRVLVLTVAFIPYILREVPSAILKTFLAILKLLKLALRKLNNFIDFLKIAYGIMWNYKSYSIENERRKVKRYGEDDYTEEERQEFRQKCSK